MTGKLTENRKNNLNTELKKMRNTKEITEIINSFNNYVGIRTKNEGFIHRTLSNSLSVELGLLSVGFNPLSVEFGLLSVEFGFLSGKLNPLSGNLNSLSGKFNSLSGNLNRNY